MNFQFIGFLFVFVVTVSCSDAECEPDPDNMDTLQLVHILFRHGNRTTLQDMIYPNDPHINETYYPFGSNELTIEGKRNAYLLGLEMRERYDSFLGDVYFPPEVKAYTSNTSRTQMTLQAVLTAMYPPVHPNTILPYLMWQPISYTTIPTKEDKWINVDCPGFSTFTTKKNKEQEEFYQYVSKHTGWDMKNANDMMNVYNTILVEKQNGFPVPDWAAESFNSGKLGIYAMGLWDDLIRHKLPILGGNFIKKVTEDSIQKINNESPAKLILYSGHDTTIAIILGVLDAYKRFEIEYLSHIYFELHKINNEYGIKVFFQNGPLNKIHQIKFGKCTEDFCKMDDFIESTKYAYIPEPKCD